MSAIVKEPEVGEIYEGQVVGIKTSVPSSSSRLLRTACCISLAWPTVASVEVEDVLNVGDTVKVEVIEIDPKSGKISLDRLDKPEAPEGSAPAPARAPRGEGRRERSDRRPGRANREANSGDGRMPRRRH